MERVIRWTFASGTLAQAAKMSLSRSPIAVIMAAPANTVLARSAVVVQRCDSLFSERRFSCATLTRPRRVQIRPATNPRQPPPAALGLAQPTPASGYGAEIDLAGVLDGQHMPACGCRAGPITPSVDHPFCGHPRVIEKSSKPDLLSPLPMGQLAQAHGRMRSHALEKHRPLLSRRRSPNRPNDTSSSNIATLRVGQSVCHRITRQRSKGIPKVHPESLCHTTTCACPSAKAGTHNHRRFSLI